jgi:hypothetical protein
MAALRFEYAVYVVPANSPKLDIRVLRMGANSSGLTTVNYATSDGAAKAGQGYSVVNVLNWN